MLLQKYCIVGRVQYCMSIM